jgi:hypothetical protein
MKWWIIRICTFLDFVRSILDPEGRDKDMLSFQMRAKAQEWENRAATTKKATVRIAPPPEQAVRIIGKVEIESGWHDKWHPAMSSMTEAQIAEFLNKAGLIPQSRTHRIAPRQNPDAGTNRVLAAWG